MAIVVHLRVEIADVVELDAQPVLPHRLHQLLQVLPFIVLLLLRSGTRQHAVSNGGGR